METLATLYRHYREPRVIEHYRGPTLSQYTALYAYRTARRRLGR